MSTFISFSGSPSRSVARLVVAFLQLVYDRSSPWMSDHIEPGQQWNEVLLRRFFDSSAIVLCHTRENQAAKSQWLPFEAGAVWKGGAAPVLSLLVDSELIPGPPLNQFQAAQATPDGLIAIVGALRNTFDPGVRWTTGDDARLRQEAVRAAKEIEEVVRKERDAFSVPTQPVIGARPHERAGEDFQLQDAKVVELLGLTYKQLSDAVSRPSFQLSATDITLAIYALPVLDKCHPKLWYPARMSAMEIADEWRTCFRNVIQLVKKCASCETIVVRLACFEPGFGMSALERHNGVREIRYTPYVPGHEPMNLPTLRLYADTQSRTQFFDEYDAVRRLYFDSDRTLRFVLKAGGSWIGPDKIDEFIIRLSRVCTNPVYADADRMYEVTATVSTSSPLAPEVFAQHADLKGWWCGHRLSSMAAGSRGELGLSYPDAQKTFAPIRGLHVVGSFVLMHHGGKVMLTSVQAVGSFPKGRWSHDVPGGRVSNGDVDLEEAAIREVFEETGILLDRGRLAPFGIGYDPIGPLVHRPVVAVYFGYKLTAREAKFVDVVGRDTKGHKFDWFKIPEFQARLRDEPGLCHVPAWVASSL